jgi:hypothetical protein
VVVWVFSSRSPCGLGGGWRLPIGVLVMVCVGYLGVSINVPMNEPDFYAPVDGEDWLPSMCGPGGIPTWWPAWAPL